MRARRYAAPKDAEGKLAVANEIDRGVKMGALGGSFRHYAL